MGANYLGWRVCVCMWEGANYLGAGNYVCVCVWGGGVQIIHKFGGGGQNKLIGMVFRLHDSWWWG